MSDLSVKADIDQVAVTNPDYEYRPNSTVTQGKRRSAMWRPL
jgi:hypothetical protein